MARRVVVTGAGRGFGRAIAEVLTDRDWEVWATDRDGASLDGTSAARHEVMDVTDPYSVGAVMDRAASDRGVDAVINNAGICKLRSWEEHDAGLMKEIYDVNVVGTLHVSQAGAKSMIAHGRGGSIVNVVSLAAYKGFPTGIGYAASKGALMSLTRSMAIALGPYKIRVNAVAPGFMDTGTTRRLVQEGMIPGDRLSSPDADRRLPGKATPAGAAAVVAVMLDPAFAEVTGQVIASDGGTHFI